MKSVAVLFAHRHSAYKAFDLADVYDEDRNALCYAGSLPVVAHPPCRSWGRLRHLSKHSEAERDLAIFAVDQVRRCGGVLEHPSFSTLWPAAGLPYPGQRDAFGGLTYTINQSWFGHRAPKLTWLYVVGASIPPVPFALGLPAGRVELMGRTEREKTPVDLAKWLLDLAQSCNKDSLSRREKTASRAAPGSGLTFASPATLGVTSC